MQDLREMLEELPATLPSGSLTEINDQRTQLYLAVRAYALSCMERKYGPLGGDLGPRFSLFSQQEIKNRIIATHIELFNKLSTEVMEHSLSQIKDVDLASAALAKCVLMDGVSWFKEICDGVWLEPSWPFPCEDKLYDPAYHWLFLGVLDNHISRLLAELPMKLAAAQIQLQKLPRLRREAVTAFLEKERIRTGQSVSQKYVWSKRYRDHSEFQRWIRNDPRTSRTGTEFFNKEFEEFLVNGDLNGSEM